MKHLVAWAKAEPILIGKNKIESDDLIYRSKCGRFEIIKRHYASGRNGHFNLVRYEFKNIATGKVIREIESLLAAKTYANWVIDPNWDWE